MVRDVAHRNIVIQSEVGVVGRDLVVMSGEEPVRSDREFLTLVAFGADGGVGFLDKGITKGEFEFFGEAVEGFVEEVSGLRVEAVELVKGAEITDEKVIISRKEVVNYNEFLVLLGISIMLDLLIKLG